MICISLFLKILLIQYNNTMLKTVKEQQQITITKKKVH